MAHSIVQLGNSRADDDALRDALGGDAQTFFVLAQRMLWGREQADLIRVDVDRTIATLLAAYPGAPAVHAMAAYGLRMNDRPAADRAMERARELATGTHPHRYLLPSPEEWAGAKPEQALDSLIPDQVWRVGNYDSISGHDLARENVSTLVRTTDAGLVLINPVEMSDDVVRAIESLGEVRAIVLQGKSHSRSMLSASRRFPKARTFATLSHRHHPASANLVFDALLDEESPSTDLRTLPVPGTQLEEFVLFHEPTRLMILQDLLHANLRDMVRAKEAS